MHNQIQCAHNENIILSLTYSPLHQNNASNNKIPTTATALCLSLSQVELYCDSCVFMWSVWSVSIFTSGVSHLSLWASFVWGPNNQVVSLSALPIQIPDSQQHPVLQHSTWHQSFGIDTEKTEMYISTVFSLCLTSLNLKSGWGDARETVTSPLGPRSASVGTMRKISFGFSSV